MKNSSTADSNQWIVIASVSDVYISLEDLVEPGILDNYLIPGNLEIIERKREERCIRWVPKTPIKKEDVGVEAFQRLHVQFEIPDLKSFKKIDSANGSCFRLVFMLKDGTTFPHLEFKAEAGDRFMSELHKLTFIRQSSKDPNLHQLTNYDPRITKATFEELGLFDDVYSSTASYHRGSSRAMFASTSHHVLTPFVNLRNLVKNAFTGELISGDHIDFEVQKMMMQDRQANTLITKEADNGFQMVCKTTPRMCATLPSVNRGDAGVTRQEFENLCDTDGRVVYVEHLKTCIFRSGIEPGMRKLLWKYLLGYFKWSNTRNENLLLQQEKHDEYKIMKVQWSSLTAEQELRNDVIRSLKSLIEKDVQRTDRGNAYFKNNENGHLTMLHDILMTYVMYNFNLGYVQGMSDLLSPILCIMDDECDAFWCFTGFMDKVESNFHMEQVGIKKQMQHLSSLVEFTDSELFNYLDGKESDNMYFAFRWLLLHFKREFNFDNIFYLWEVLWTELPCDNFHLLICIAILDDERGNIMHNKFGLVEILKHINDIAMHLKPDPILLKAESLCIQLQACKHTLPTDIANVLGFNKLPTNNNGVNH